MTVWTRRAALALAAVAVLLALALAWWYGVQWQRYDKAQSLLQSRSERLDGLLQAGPRITSDLQAARAVVSPRLHPAGEDAANAVQQHLRELIAAGGNTLVSSQVALQPAAENQLAQIQVSATVTGSWAGLVGFMQQLQKQTPPYWVQTAALTREGANQPTAPQMARLALQLQAPLAPSQKGAQ